MLPKWHLLIGFVFSYVLVYFFNFSVLSGVIVFLSSWLIIDFDHYLLYLSINKDFSLSRAYYSFLLRKEKYLKLSLEERQAQQQYKRNLLIFHGIEFWIILGILSYFNNIFLFILLGFFIHMLADWTEMYFIQEPIYMKFSQTYTFIKNKKLKEFVLK